MATAARIPFSPTDERMIASLGSWMIFVAIVHFLVGLLFVGGAGLVALAGVALLSRGEAAGGVIITLNGLLYVGLAFVMLAEGAMILSARSAFTQMIATDSEDQSLLTTAFRRLRIFFLLEVAWFGGTLIAALLTVALAIAAPEHVGGSAGRDLVEQVREMRGDR